ncbi:unnamed protein product, partial [Vitis vinifera]
MAGVSNSFVRPNENYCFCSCHHLELPFFYAFVFLNFLIGKQKNHVLIKKTPRKRHTKHSYYGPMVSLLILCIIFDRSITKCPWVLTFSPGGKKKWGT